MNTPSLRAPRVRLRFALAALLATAAPAFAAPAIQSVTALPVPMRPGEPVTVTVEATDVTAGTVIVDFRPWSARLLRLAMAPAGAVWQGTALVPADLAPPPGAEASVRAIFLNAARQRAEAIVRVPVLGAPAVFDPATGILTVVGDDLDNSIAVSRDGTGALRVNGGAIPIVGGTPTIANTVLIRILGLGGNDQLTLDLSGGALPRGELRGGPGNDTLLGGQDADDLLGGPGNDTLVGRAGADRLFGELDNDTFVWNPGDGSDVLEGDGGQDTLVFNGSNASEEVDLSANGGRLRLFRNVANIVMDVAGVEQVLFGARGGADTIAVRDLSGTDVADIRLDLANPPGAPTPDGQADRVIVEGTLGNDALAVAAVADGVQVSGSRALVTLSALDPSLDQLEVLALGGQDTIDASALPGGRISLIAQGGDGNDVLRGSRGADLLFGGPDNDTFVWNPGDGSDVLEGDGGQDTLVFNGSNASEAVDLSANGSRLRLFRNVANIVMDVAGTERVQFAALGGADVVTVNSLVGTAVSEVRVDLTGPSGGGAGDAQPDTVVIQGTAGPDAVVVNGSPAGVNVLGLSALVTVLSPEPANDQLLINSLSEADTIDATGLPQGLLNLVVNAGPGSDVILGSQGNDVLLGGPGTDVVLAGPGDDTLLWNPGDGSDVLEGQAGLDTLLFNGSNASENIDASANGGRLRFFRDVGNVNIDANDVEQVLFNALGGADTIAINDLSGTDVTDFRVDLANPAGSATGDGQADTVLVNGTSGDDVILAVGDTSGVSIFGLATQVSITRAEVSNDRLIIRSLAGDDVIEGTGLTADAIQFVGDGGDDDDVLLGGDGNDVLLGGPGDDVLIGGPGIDVLDGGPGDNIVIQ